MVRDAEIRAAAAERQQKHRSSSHASVTPMSQRSSSSTLISTSQGKSKNTSAGADASARISQPVAPTKESQAREPAQLELGQPREKNHDPMLMLEIYEQERGPLPAVKVRSRERLSKARTMLLSHNHDQERFLADFRAAVRKASQTAWPSWRPSIDWFIANGTNYGKVLEGHHDNWSSGNGGRFNVENRGGLRAEPGKYENIRPFKATNS